MHPHKNSKNGISCKMVLQAVGKVLRKSKPKPNGKKAPAEEKKQYLEPEFTKTRVVDFDLKELVVLPREIDLNEWLASNTTTFFNLINLQYSTISEFCTGDTCQAMTAACSTTYYWYDEKGRKTKCTAPQYVDFVMSLCQKLVTDEEIFPTKYGKEFPNSFESLVKKICRYLFHVLAHLYWAHFKETVALDLQGHLNTLFAHFMVFVREFNLVDPKETFLQVTCRGQRDVRDHSGQRHEAMSAGGCPPQHVRKVVFIFTSPFNFLNRIFRPGRVRGGDGVSEHPARLDPIPRFCQSLCEGGGRTAFRVLLFIYFQVFVFLQGSSVLAHFYVF
uniref:MOB kinase activator 2a n=1 Tax=Oryzias melastigma TaxID=30732 RepID=A0A3B3CWX3_ORYME